MDTDPGAGYFFPCDDPGDDQYQIGGCGQGLGSQTLGVEGGQSQMLQLNGAAISELLSLDMDNLDGTDGTPLTQAFTFFPSVSYMPLVRKLHQTHVPYLQWGGGRR